MIIADGIRCRIPSEYAVKISELFCTVAHPVDSANSQTWATWLGAIGTFFAVFVASRAWKTAREANDQANQNLRTQLDEQRNLALHQMELTALAKFSENLIWFVNNTLLTDRELMDDLKSNDVKREASATELALEDYVERERELTMSWMAWSMFVIATDDDLREASNSFVTKACRSSKEIRDQQIRELKLCGENQLLAASLGKMVYKGDLETLFADSGSFIADLQFVRQKGKGWQKLRSRLIANNPRID
ncbi:hypothetical protein [Glutamicibacter soli]